MLYHVLNALVNKSVFSLDLKTEIEEAILIEVGKSFHSLGPTTLKRRRRIFNDSRWWQVSL